MNKSCQFIWFLDPKYVFVDVLIALQMLERCEVRSLRKVCGSGSDYLVLK